jgi:hypothetical protein
MDYKVYQSKEAYIEATNGSQCAIDVSFGGIDLDGEPMPSDIKYSPCGAPSVGVDRNTPLCARHWMACVEHEDVAGMKQGQQA